jgi:hypothetical protein
VSEEVEAVLRFPHLAPSEDEIEEILDCIVIYWLPKGDDDADS